MHHMSVVKKAYSPTVANHNLLHIMIEENKRSRRTQWSREKNIVACEKRLSCVTYSMK